MPKLMSKEEVLKKFEDPYALKKVSDLWSGGSTKRRKTIQIENKPRKSKAYHISQEAIDICNRLGMDPSETILYLNAEVEKQSAFIDVKKAMREVMQVEGVTLLRVADTEMLEKCFPLVISSEIQKGKDEAFDEAVKLLKEGVKK